MQWATLLIAATASVLVFCSAPLYGLITYVAALAWYPSYLTIKAGTVDFNVSRIVILAIFLNLLLRGENLKHFKFIWLDKLVIIYFVGQILAGATTNPSFMEFLENRAGAVFDIVLPYFAVRLIITDRSQYVTLLKWLVVIAAPLAVTGFYQCLTGNNPVGFLKKYHAWKSSTQYIPIPRHGFFRADVTFPMSIMFGLFFAMFGPICAGLLRNVRENKKMIYWIGLGLMGLGMFSSVSSGSILAGLLAMLFLMFYPYRRYWKTVVVMVIVGCVVVEIISNRHFYDVLGRFTFNSATAWYRSKLIEVALYKGGMSGHWLVGFGTADPGWSAMIDGRGHTDIVNHYLLVLSRYGLVGFVPFALIIVAATKKLILAYRASLLPADRWLIWTLAAALFGLLGAMNSVSLFGQPVTFFFMMLGFCGVMPGIVKNTNARFINSLRDYEFVNI